MPEALRDGPLAWQSALADATEILDAVPCDRLDLDLLIRVHQILLPASNPFRGQLRDRPVVIRLDGAVVRGMPPACEARAMAADALRDLGTTLASGGLLPDAAGTASEILVRLSGSHPFFDGNGRVARAVANWVLGRGGYRVIRDPGRYCRERKPAYYRALALCQGVPPDPYDPHPWDDFFAGLVAECYRHD